MKSLIPWRKRNREMTHYHQNRKDVFDHFFDLPIPFNESIFSDQNWYPNLDISEGKKDIVVKAEMPGVDRKDIDISIDGRLLTIKGEKKREKEESNESYHRVESSYGYFRRMIDLPTDVDASNVDATYKKGILKLKLKKAKEAETKSIEVKTA